MYDVLTRDGASNIKTLAESKANNVHMCYITEQLGVLVLFKRLSIQRDSVLSCCHHVTYRALMPATSYLVHGR